MKSIICEKNENLKFLIFQIIKLGKTKKIKDLFVDEIDEIFFTMMKSKSSFQHFVDKTVDCLQAEDLEKVIIENRLLKLMMIEKINAESIKYFIEKTLTKIDKQVIIQSLKLDVIRIYPFRKTYLFTYLTKPDNYCLTRSDQSSFIELKERFELIRSLYSNIELVDLFINHYDDGKNFIYYILNLEDPKIMKYLWNEMQNAFLLTNSNQELKSLVNQNRLLIFNIFDELSSKSYSAERFLSTLNIFLKTVENREELQNIGIIFTFFKDLISFNNIELIEEFFENFEKNQLLDAIFFYKESNGQNLLQYVIKDSKNLILFQIMWKYLEKSENYLFEVLKQVDSNLFNIFNTAATSESQEIVDFLLAKLDNFLSTENFKELLSNKDIFDLNPLQTAVHKNILLEINKSLWNVYNKYFSLSEIVNMTSIPNKFNDNLVFLMVYNHSEEVVRFTWSKIKDFIKLQKNYGNEELKVFKTLFTSKGFAGRNILQTAACNVKNLAIYKFLWEISKEFFESNQEFVNYLSETDSEKNNILSLAAYFSTLEVFNFTIMELEKLATVSQIQSILHNSNLWTKNAIFCIKSFTIYESFMQFYHKYFASN